MIGVASSARNVATERTQAGQAADVLRANARPNDLVVYCPDQLGPDLSRLLEGERLRQRTFPGGAPP